LIHRRPIDFTDFAAGLDRFKIKLEKHASDVIAVYLFGSCARNEFKPLSDVDIGILFVPPVKSELETRVLINAMEALHTEEVDLVVLNDAPLHIQYEAIKERKIIFCTNHERRADFETRVLMEYLDFAPIRNEFFKEYMKRLGLGG